MQAKLLFLPALALGGAALLLGPAPRSEGFSLLGSDLDLANRDARVFNNFTDAAANNNVTPDAQFPGHQGAVMAIWKGLVEWGSEIHGTGTGDPSQVGDLGSGGANFDAAFGGEANAVGGLNDKVHSELNVSDTGVFAFCEAGGAGWRIRYHQNWNWSDGPNQATFGQTDIQGISCHEYGHALGLDHSTAGLAVMFPSTVSGNDTRDLFSDDINGVKAIYGTKAVGKPHISSVGLVGQTLTITGTGFSATNNEVWFANQLVTAPASAALVKATAVASTGGGTQISLTLPTLAGHGDVLVKNSGTGNSALSNAFPFNGQGVGPSSPQITGITPSSVNAVNVGTSQFVTISGTNFTPDITLSVNGVPVFGIPSPYTIVNSTTITLDPPLPTALGTVNVKVENAFGSSTSQITYQQNPTPALQAGSGNEPVTFTSFSGLELTFGGTPNATHFIGFSVFNLPSVLPGVVNLEIGNNFTNLFQLGGGILIGPAGWSKVTFPSSPALVPVTTFFLECISFEPVPVLPLPDSNKQQILFLF
jgi:hypothetical protein